MPNTAADRAVVNPGLIEEPHLHVVAAIVNDPRAPQRFLIAQRQKGKHLAEHWEFPGGKREFDESPWHALRRELEEEINITILEARPFMQVYYPYPDRNVLLDTWWVESYRGDVVALEGQRLQWIEIDQAGAYQFPPADIPILEAIANSATAETRRLP